MNTRTAAKNLLGAVHKSRPKSGRRGFVQCVHFPGKGKGVFRCEGPHFLVQKSSDFSKFMVCPHRHGGRRVGPVRTFFLTRGSIFRDFARTFFMDGPLRQNFCKTNINENICKTNIDTLTNQFSLNVLKHIQKLYMH